MFVKLNVYNYSDYADGQGHHEPGIRHALTPPSVIILNTALIESIEKNRSQFAHSYCGGPCVGQSDYVLRTSSQTDWYIMKEDAIELIQLLNPTLL